MAITFAKIETAAVTSGGAANITFSNIPADYTDLILFISARTDRSGAVPDNLSISYNNSTSSQSDLRIFGDGSGVNLYADSSNIYAGLATGAGATASTFGNTMIYIPNYAGSNNKPSLSDGVAENNGATGAMNIGAELWANTAAITSIKIESRYSATFQQHSTASLYGIKKN